MCRKTSEIRMKDKEIDMTVIKTYYEVLLYSAAAVISHQIAIFRTTVNKLLSEKLNYTTAIVALSLLLIFQFSLYEFDINEYFSM